MPHRPLPGQMVCPRMTGAWIRAGDREVWSGEHGEKQIPCGYTGDAHTLLCHFIATHRIPVERARGLMQDVPAPRSL